MSKLFMQSRLIMSILLLFVCSSGLSQTVDVLTADDFPATSTTYKVFTGQSFNSTAVYAGCTARDGATGPIRLTKTKASEGHVGLVATSSGGNITNVKVYWNSETTSGRAVNVYGKKTAYSTAADLYSDDTDGDNLGTIKYGTNDYLSLDGKYQYIGIRANNQLVYIDKIEITYVKPGETIKQKQTLAFSKSSLTVSLKEAALFTPPTLTGLKTTVAYSSDNTDVATVDEATGKVAVLAAGEATITATAAENEEYQSATASYKIIITDSDVITDDVFVLVAKFKGGYYAMSSLYASGRTNAMAAERVSVVNAEVIKTGNSDLTDIQWKITQDESDNTQYTFNPNTEENKDKYLSASTSGTDLSLKSTGCYWNKDMENNSWLLKDDNEKTIAYNGEYFRCYKVSNVGNAGYSDYTVAMPIVPGYIRDGLGKENVGTICLPYPVKANDYVGAEFYSILGKRLDADGVTPLSIVCAKEEGDLNAGVPYLFVSKADTLALKYVSGGEPTTVMTPANGLKGSLQQLSVEKGMYLVSENKIVKCGNNCYIPANRAYINMDEVPVYTENMSESKKIIEIGGAIVSINGVEADENASVDVYSVTGLCIRKNVLKAEATVGLPHGLYIVGGKKVLVK